MWKRLLFVVMGLIFVYLGGAGLYTGDTVAEGVAGTIFLQVGLYDLVCAYRDKGWSLWY